MREMRDETRGIGCNDAWLLPFTLRIPQRFSQLWSPGTFLTGSSHGTGDGRTEARWLRAVLYAISGSLTPWTRSGQGYRIISQMQLPVA